MAQILIFHMARPINRECVLRLLLIALREKQFEVLREEYRHDCDI